MRGIIFYLLSQLFRKKYYVVIVSAIIFGFALHTGGDFLSNLVYRFPAGIILAVLRIYTKNYTRLWWYTLCIICGAYICKER